MITKENTLFGIIGLLLGLIVGFMFANSVNQTQYAQSTPGSPGAPAGQTGPLPPGHPAVPGGNAASMPEVQTAIDEAKQKPENFEAQMKAAELFYQIQRYDGAIEYLKKANELKPDHYETIVNLGNAYFDSDKYDEAEKWYTAALKKKPDDANVLTDLGLTFIFRSTPDYDRAVKEFNRVLEINPMHPQALQNLTVADTKKGDAANANSTLERLQAADPSNEAIAKLGEEIKKLQSGGSPAGS